MKTTKKVTGFLLAGVAAATLVGASVAMAHDEGFGGKRRGMEMPAFGELDHDGDGRITVEDLIARADARFAAADSNGDAVLDGEELAAGFVKRMEDRAGRGEAAHRDGGHGRMNGDHAHDDSDGTEGHWPGMAKRAGWMVERMIERRDRNGDGVLSADELRSVERMERMIDRLDTDDDNAISAAEYDAAEKERFFRRMGHRKH